MPTSDNRKHQRGRCDVGGPKERQLKNRTGTNINLHLSTTLGSGRTSRGIILRTNESSRHILLDKSSSLVYSMPVAKWPMTDNAARDLFPGALEMMILESLRRRPAHGYALVQHCQHRSNNLL